MILDALGRLIAAMLTGQDAYDANAALLEAGAARMWWHCATRLGTRQSDLDERDLAIDRVEHALARFGSPRSPREVDAARLAAAIVAVARCDNRRVAHLLTGFARRGDPTAAYRTIEWDWPQVVGRAA